jgi:serine/threonine-protein kinase
MSEPTTQLKPSQQIGPCIVRDFIGRGKDTEVYRAFYPDLKQEVALKILHSKAGSPEKMAACFRQDMQPIADLKHPNIMRVFGFGVAEGRYYIIMELIEGTGLRDLISAHPTGLDRDETMRIFSQLASAVATAHDLHVVHGNIKPDNVLLDPKQRPVLTDFSIPCLQEHRSDLGWTSTPAYLAPEQITASRAMPESDIYALGILLYEMVTGDVPFKGTAQEVSDQHKTAQPVPPGEINVSLDPRIDRAIMKALDKLPMSRYSSARVMLAALESQEVKDQFSTVSLSRKDMEEPRRRASEIKRFQQARLDDTETESVSITESSSTMWMGAALIIAVVIMLAALFLL